MLAPRIPGDGARYDRGAVALPREKPAGGAARAGDGPRRWARGRPHRRARRRDADAKTLLARALEAAAAGRHHDAAALLWASALRALDERGRVRYDPARTPGEWRREVRDPSFDVLARDAVVALFGDRGADAALVARMREAYDRVVVAR